MKVLIACEESQRVCIAFRERGHEAYSCDDAVSLQVSTLSKIEAVVEEIMQSLGV